MLRRLLHLCAFLAPITLGVIWLWAGIPKVLDLFSSELAVRAYMILPETAAHYVGYTLPIIEVVMGLLLIVGIALRPCAVASICLLCVYIAAIISVWARGMRIHCGCFNKGGPAAQVQWTEYLVDIVRDGIFIGIALVIFCRPASWLNCVLRRTATLEDHPEPEQITPAKLNLATLDLPHLVPLTSRDEPNTHGSSKYGGKIRGKTN